MRDDKRLSDLDKDPRETATALFRCQRWLVESFNVTLNYGASHSLLNEVLSRRRNSPEKTEKTRNLNLQSILHPQHMHAAYDEFTRPWKLINERAIPISSVRWLFINCVIRHVLVSIEIPTRLGIHFLISMTTQLRQNSHREPHMQNVIQICTSRKRNPRFRKANETSIRTTCGDSRYRKTILAFKELRALASGDF